MTNTLVAGSGLTILLAWWIARRLGHVAGPPRQLPAMTAAEAEEIGDRYLPMERLLGEADTFYLTRLAGLPANRIRDFRARRRKLFREYLRCMTRDFHRIYRTLEVTLVEAGEERAELAGLLLRQRARFLTGMLSLEIRLAVNALGAGETELRRTLEPLRTLCGARHLLPATGRV